MQIKTRFQAKSGILQHAGKSVQESDKDGVENLWQNREKEAEQLIQSRWD